MDERVIEAFGHIRVAATLIAEMADGTTYDEYVDDRGLTLAVERLFINIGEAMNRIAPIDEASAMRLAAYPRAIGFRNVLVHRFDGIQQKTVWSTIQIDVPILIAQTEAILAEAG